MDSSLRCYGSNTEPTSFGEFEIPENVDDFIGTMHERPDGTVEEATGLFYWSERFSKRHEEPLINDEIDKWVDIRKFSISW